MNTRLFLSVGFFLTLAGLAHADWRDDLQTEKAANSTRMEEINTEGQALKFKLDAVKQQVSVHDSQRCTYTDENPHACDSYDQEARRLDDAQDKIINQIHNLSQEFDNLASRNQKIDNLLNRVQLPHECHSSADCEVSGCCGNWDGDRQAGFCQPSC